MLVCIVLSLAGIALAVGLYQADHEVQRIQYAEGLIRQGFTFNGYTCLHCGNQFDEYPRAEVACPECKGAVRIVMHDRYKVKVPITKADQVCLFCHGQDETCTMCNGSGVE